MGRVQSRDRGGRVIIWAMYIGGTIKNGTCTDRQGTAKYRRCTDSEDIDNVHSRERG